MAAGFARAVKRHDLPAAIEPESKAPAAVAVCGNGSLLIQTTTSPRRTVSVSGTYTQSLDHDLVRARRPVGRDGVARRGRPARRRAIQPAQRGRSAPTRPIAPVSPFLPSLRLQALCVLEVRDERRPDLDQQGLQLGVLRARDERLVDRVEHLLVVRDLVVDVGLVERGAASASSGCVTLSAPPAFRLLLVGVVFRRDLELGHERDRLLVDAGVVGDHLLAERLDFGVAAPSTRRACRRRYRPGWR